MSADFIDSNVFVHLFDATDERKQLTARALIDRSIGTGDGHISFQVVQETLSVITRKVVTPATSDDASRFFEEVLRPLWRVMPSVELYRGASTFRRAITTASMTRSSSQRHFPPGSPASSARTSRTANALKV